MGQLHPMEGHLEGGDHRCHTGGEETSNVQHRWRSEKCSILPWMEKGGETITLVPPPNQSIPCD